MPDNGTRALLLRSSRYFTVLGERTLSTFWRLSKIMLPVMVLVQIGEEFGLSQKLGILLGPIMKLVGLPPEAGIVWGVTIITGIYGGVGAYVTLLPVLELSAAQISILASMMLFAHALPVEQAIVREAKAAYFATGVLRIVAAFLYGALVFLVCQKTGILSEANNLSWIASDAVMADDATSRWISWGITTLKSLFSMLVIIAICFLSIDALEKLGVIEKITHWLTPFLDRIGIPSPLVPLTTIGLMLGLAYGGGLILEATRKHQFSSKELFLPFACLSLLHALVEDTLLMIAIGGDVWIVLVFRVVFSLCLLWLLARFIKLAPKWLSV